MGCKCNKRSKRISKYTDNNEEPMEALVGLRKIGAVIFRTIIGILMFAIIIGMIPLIAIYLVINVIIGRETVINIKKLFRLNGRK